MPKKKPLHPPRPKPHPVTTWQGASLINIMAGRMIAGAAVMPANPPGNPFTRDFSASFGATPP